MQNVIRARSSDSAVTFYSEKTVVIGVFVLRPALQKGLCSPRIWRRVLF